MTAIRNQQAHKNYNKMYIAFFNLLSFGAAYIIVAPIVLRQLFLHTIWKYTDLNGHVTRGHIITIVSRVKLIVYYNSFFIHESYLVRFSLFHARSLSEGSNKSAHLAVSLEPLPNRKFGIV